MCALQVGAVPANIKWVDDSHALIVCASQDAAQVLLDARQHSYKLRPYHQASDASQVRAAGIRGGGGVGQAGRQVARLPAGVRLSSINCRHSAPPPLHVRELMCGLS